MTREEQIKEEARLIAKALVHTTDTILQQIDKENKKELEKYPDYEWDLLDSLHVAVTEGFEAGAKWADKTVLSMVQEYITCHQMTIADGKSESFVDGYNNALVHLRDFFYFIN